MTNSTDWGIITLGLVMLILSSLITALGVILLLRRKKVEILLLQPIKEQLETYEELFWGFPIFGPIFIQLNRYYWKVFRGAYEALQSNTREVKLFDKIRAKIFATSQRAKIFALFYGLVLILFGFTMTIGSLIGILAGLFVER